MANNMSFAGDFSELQASIQGGPQKLYPEFVIPLAKAPTMDEKLQVKFFKEVQSSIINETPFYVQARTQVSAGDGIERYSDKWKPKRKATQSLVDLRTDETFFPEELLPVLRGDVAGRKKRKQQTFDLGKFLDMNVEPDAAENSSIAGENNDEDASEDEAGEEDDAFSDDGNDYEDNYFSGGENDFEDAGGDEEAY